MNGSNVRPWPIIVAAYGKFTKSEYRPSDAAVMQLGLFVLWRKCSLGAIKLKLRFQIWGQSYAETDSNWKFLVRR